jgi:hypothetical protein
LGKITLVRMRKDILKDLQFIPREEKVQSDVLLPLGKITLARMKVIIAP